MKLAALKEEIYRGKNEKANQDASYSSLSGKKSPQSVDNTVNGSSLPKIQKEVTFLEPDRSDDEPQNIDKERYKQPSLKSEVSMTLIDSKTAESGLKVWRKESMEQDIKQARKGIFIKKTNVWHTRHLLEYLYWTVIALIIQFVVGGGTGYWAFPFEDKERPICSTDDPDYHKMNICTLRDSLEHGAQRFIILSAFILGGFLASSVNLWLSRRNAYIKVW